jgi:hypothetical protein
VSTPRMPAEDYHHPALEDVTLDAALAALSDPH